jgi:hypothetical protein
MRFTCFGYLGGCRFGGIEEGIAGGDGSPRGGGKMRMLVEFALVLVLAVFATLLIVGVPFALLTLAGITIPQILVTVVAALVASVTANLLMLRLL